MLRGVLDVDARAGGHGPSHRRPVRAEFVSLPLRTVQPSTAAPGPDSRMPVTTLGPPAAHKLRPSPRPWAPPTSPTASTSGPPDLRLPEPALTEERFRAGSGCLVVPEPGLLRRPARVPAGSGESSRAEAEQTPTCCTSQSPTSLRISCLVHAHSQGMGS